MGGCQSTSEGAIIIPSAQVRMVYSSYTSSYVKVEENSSNKRGKEFEDLEAEM